MSSAQETGRKRTADKPARRETPTEFSTTFAKEGIQGPKLRNMRLEHAPTRFLHIPDGDDMVHVALIDDQFTGIKLINLLATVTPTKSLEPNIDDVMGDLVLPSGARKLGREKANPDNQWGQYAYLYERTIWLQEQHENSERIGNAYKEFDAHHREAHMAALDTTLFPIDYLYSTAWNTQFIDKNYRKRYFSQILQPPTTEDHSRQREYESSLINLVISFDGYSKTQRIFSNFRNQPENLRKPYQALLEDFTQSTDPDTVHALNYYVTRGKRTTTFVDIDNNRLIPAHSEAVSDPDDPSYKPYIQTKLLATGEVEYKKRYKNQTLKIRIKQEGEANRRGNWTMTEVVRPNTVLPNALSPVIAYRVRNGERIYLAQPELDTLLTSNQIALPPGMRPDVALGRIAMAYLSPDHITGIEKSMSLSPHTRKQPLNEAQVVVLYSLSRHNSKYYQDKEEDGPADQVLSPDNPAIRVLETVN
jgi:hypothetical protein